MAVSTPSHAPLTAASWNDLQVCAREALLDHDHAAAPLSGQVLSPDAQLRVEWLKVGRARLAGQDLSEAIAARLPLVGGAVPGDMDVAGGLVLHQPLTHGDVVTPRLSPLVASYRAADGRVVERDRSTGQWGRWHTLVGIDVDINEATVALVHAAGAFEPWYDSTVGSGHYCRLAPFVQIDAHAPLGTVELAALADPRDRAAWSALASAASRTSTLDFYVVYQNAAANAGLSVSDLGVTEPFSFLIAVPLPPGASTVLLRASYAPQSVAWATLTVTPIPT